MNDSLFSKFSDAIRHLLPAEIANPQSVASLRLDSVQARERHVEMVYAPFDYVNRDARLAIVGMTPGRQQAANALRAAHFALNQGRSDSEAARDAKVFASFSGAMRDNLVRMLDRIGVARHLGLPSTASLWNGASDLVHFTSALRYPVFVDGANWSGQPDMVRTPRLRAWLERYTGVELATMPKALLVPLGPKVAGALHHLADQGIIDAGRILDGLPHPSGANAERIACFLGTKPINLASSRTNGAALVMMRDTLEARLSRL